MTHVVYENCEYCGKIITGNEDIIKISSGISREKDSILRKYFEIFKSAIVKTTYYYHIGCMELCIETDNIEEKHLVAQRKIKNRLGV